MRVEFHKWVLSSVSGQEKVEKAQRIDVVHGSGDDVVDCSIKYYLSGLFE